MVQGGVWGGQPTETEALVWQNRKPLTEVWLNLSNEIRQRKNRLLKSHDQ